MMIKRTFFVLFMCVLIFAPGTTYAQGSIEWIYDIEKAKESAQGSARVLMIVALTDWDHISRSLVDKTLKDEGVVALSRRFSCLQVSVYSKDFLKGLGISIYPTTVFFNVKDGNLQEIDRIEGYETPDVFIKEMKNVLRGRDTLLFLKEKVGKESFDTLPQQEKSEILRKLAEKMSNQGKYYEAKDYFQKLNEIDKRNKEEYSEKINYLRALIYLEQRKTINAIALLENIDTKDAHFELIRAYLMDNNFNKALPLIKEFVNDYPKDEKVPFLLDIEVGFYFKVGRYKKGLDSLLNIIKGYPDTFFAEKSQGLIDTMLVWPPRRQEFIIRREVEDVVVITPDIKTYLYHISLWTDKKIYPVLLKGSKLNDKFIKAFKPKEIKKAKSVILPGAIDEELLYRALYTSWTDQDLLTAITKNITKDSIKEYFNERNFIPLGIVLTRPKDGGMPGGLAVASARTQVLDFLPDTIKDERIVDYEKMSSLREKITDIIKEWGYPLEGFLDGIDYITIAGNFPYAYDYNITTSPGRYSLDDALGREDDNQRCAYVGRFLGNWNMSIYQAMCSIFLQPRDVLFFNTYDHDGTWRDYRTDFAAGSLSGVLETTNIENEAADLERWQALMTSEGNEYDLVFVNSSGGSKDWSTFKGQGGVEDIPESVPAIVILTHSNSAADPYDAETIAGRWLENGAYLYFGSVSEPYVQSFNTPYDIVTDLLFGRTFIESLHRNAGPWSCPWRLIFIGDPVYSLIPPEIQYRQVEEFLDIESN